MFHGRSGEVVLVRGGPGIGKTAAVRRVLMDLDTVDEATNISWVYVNCWRFNSSYKIVVEIAHLLGHQFTHNKNTSEIMDEIKKIALKHGFDLSPFFWADKIIEKDAIEEIKSSLKYA